MKTQAIATLITAAVVSFFQVKDPEVKSAVTAPETLSAASVSQAPETAPSWSLVRGDTGLQLLQSDGQATTDDPLRGQTANSFSGGGVASLAEVPAVTAGEAIPLDLTQEAVVDVAEPTRMATVDAVNEVTVEPVVVPSVAIPQAGVTTSPPTPATPTPMVEPASENGAAQTAAVAAPLDEAELAGAPVKTVAAAEPAEVESIPAFPVPAETTTGQVGAKPSGLAEKLVSTVNKAVGNEKEEAEQAEPTMGEESGGFWLRAAKLNDVFQYLARLGHAQYFHNADLEAANFVVTGHLSEGDPLKQMEELGLMYGITIHHKGNTVYAMTNAQLAQLPTKPFYYEMKYLRPSDIEQIKSILQPVLTPGAGTVDFEKKTNTLIFIDNEQRIENIKGILAELDRPKQQIAIETRILRIKSASRNRIGVDWESVLGDGMTIEATEALNALFNLPDSDLVEQVITSTLTKETSTGFTVTDRGTPNELTTLDPLTGTIDTAFEDETVRETNSNESHLVLSPLQLQATLRALNTGGLAQQESSPTLITEDNESGIISIIDRIPIIISTITQTDAGQNITEDVRYRVDTNDPSASDDPTASREIGVSVAVTPTILPDNTIRMALRPRSAQIVEFIEGPSGNRYPRVNESTVDTIARVPNGYSLLIGGFYEEQESEEEKKVPVLGDVPGVNFFFKSSDKIKEQTSLVFVVTPKMYSPVSIPEVDRINQELHQNHTLPNDHNWPDRKNPGTNYEPNLGRTVGNAVNVFGPTPPSNPLHPEHPVNLPQWDVRDEPGIAPGATMVESGPDGAPASHRRKGFLGNLFKKRQP